MFGITRFEGRNPNFETSEACDSDVKRCSSSTEFK